jgi:hypothetical protein
MVILDKALSFSSHFYSVPFRALALMTSPPLPVSSYPSSSPSSIRRLKSSSLYSLNSLMARLTTWVNEGARDGQRYDALVTDGDIGGTSGARVYYPRVSPQVPCHLTSHCKELVCAAFAQSRPLAWPTHSCLQRLVPRHMCCTV